MLLNHESLHNYDLLPPSAMESLAEYVRIGRPVGGFLEALLSNNLKDACAQADDINIWLLPIYVSYLHNKVPFLCWGSHEKYVAWIKFRQGE